MIILNFKEKSVTSDVTSISGYLLMPIFQTEVSEVWINIDIIKQTRLNTYDSQFEGSIAFVIGLEEQDHSRIYIVLFNIL